MCVTLAAPRGGAGGDDRGRPSVSRMGRGVVVAVADVGGEVVDERAAHGAGARALGGLAPAGLPATELSATLAAAARGSLGASV